MRTTPFSNLARFQDSLEVLFLTRSDTIGSDADIARATGRTNLVGLRQAHGNIALRVTEPSSRILQADALATDVTGLTLTIRFADCQNAVIFAPKKRVVCLVHAGWRGVRSRVMTNAYLLLRQEWNIYPEETVVALGPSLCTGCAEFTDPAKEAPELDQFFHGRHIDLQSALDAELQSIGVPKENVERASECTKCEPEKFFTYRGGDKLIVERGTVNALAVTLV